MGPSLQIVPNIGFCHIISVNRNCCCIVQYASGNACVGVGSATWMTGSQTYPIVGSTGVIGGPVNNVLVGIVGENLIKLCQCSMGSAMRMDAVSVCWKSK